jgi:hypothetical protein
MPGEKDAATCLLNLTTPQTMRASPDKYVNQTTVFAISILEDYLMPYIAI